MPKAPDVSPATVRHVSKDHVTIAPGPGYSVTIFTIGNYSVEALVVSDDGEETIRLQLEPPGVDRVMDIKRHAPTDIIDIVYKDKPHAKV